VKLLVAAGAAWLLAIAAFRRVRGVLRPSPGRSVARPPLGDPPGRAASVLVTAAVVGIAVAAVVGIVWAGLELLT